MNIKTMKIKDLKLDPSNARKHDKKNIEAIKNSLEQFGQRKNIVYWNGVIKAGNGTVMAAQELGWQEIVVDDASHMTEKEVMAYALADNRTAELAIWDEDVLGSQLQSLYEDGYAIADIGFDWEDDKAEGGGGKTDDDEVPEVEENVFGVKRGDIWQLGDHRLMCGDSTSKEDVDRLMDGDKADMVFTDPPYGIDLDVTHGGKTITNEGKKFPGRESICSSKKYKPIEGDKDYSPYHIFDQFSYCNELFIFGANNFCHLIPEYQSGSWIVWDKNGGHEGLDNGFNGAFELCWSKSRHKYKIARVTYAGIYGSDEGKAGHKRVHPSQKPAKLAEWFFDHWGKDKNNIVDLFGGSGSTLIACEKTGRKCFMSEIDPHYCSVIIKRWQDYTGKEAKLLTA